MNQPQFKAFRGSKLMRADDADGRAVMLNTGAGTDSEIRAACRRSGCKPTARSARDHEARLWSANVARPAASV